MLYSTSTNSKVPDMPFYAHVGTYADAAPVHANAYACACADDAYDSKMRERQIEVVVRCVNNSPTIDLGCRGMRMHGGIDQQPL